MTTDWVDFHARHGTGPKSRNGGVGGPFTDPAELERQRSRKMCIKTVFCCLSALVTGGGGRNRRRRRAREAVAASTYDRRPGSQSGFDDNDDFSFCFSPPRSMSRQKSLSRQKSVGNIKYMT
mmetsp:Transcript_23524/g.51151  ORF Transcript_23524/g.51151 Transcript_23524/m.51151 type:complete len:122 (-) Transcript_23524:217-582(-)|eukprot:CAMPEP_0178535556 /NCGR_PEP_ID=MMETSP0696-20121128/35606_1 /TAXON_ID=265572 /ORGANISM="Extubocellulus spinifer, Strain CCMP396" /LENGTH=121 /DNA_ID=CAMNT_0020167699 /DNA_START=164 /DNA_END=529 /DNA_ORIENTATION=-